MAEFIITFEVTGTDGTTIEEKTFNRAANRDISRYQFWLQLAKNRLSIPYAQVRNITILSIVEK